MLVHPISTREEYDYCVKRGYEPLCEDAWRFPMAHSLRVAVQKEKFGGNNAEGNQKFYKFCLHHKPLYCEECGKPITHPSAINVSHILTRGAHPEMAHDCRNVNILCFEHHNVWEHATTRKGMRIYDQNMRTIKILKEEYNKQK